MIEEKIQVAMRIPKMLHDKITDILHKNPNLTKTEVIVDLLESYFKIIESKRKDTLSEIDNAFSVENKVFMPRRVYKQLLTKSEYTIDNEISKGVIDSVMIEESEYIIMEVDLNVNAIMIELLVHKKDIEILKRNMETQEIKREN